MSSHGGSVPSQASPILVGILFALVTPLIGQGTPGHFYHVNYYQVQQGQEKAYDSALAHVVSPVFDEMVKRKAAVSYLLLKKVAGSGDYTHLVIVEVESHLLLRAFFSSNWRQRRKRRCTGPGTMRLWDSRSCGASSTPSSTRPWAKGTEIRSAPAKSGMELKPRPYAPCPGASKGDGVAQPAGPEGSGR